MCKTFRRFFPFSVDDIVVNDVFFFKCLKMLAFMFDFNCRFSLTVLGDPCPTGPLTSWMPKWA